MDDCLSSILCVGKCASNVKTWMTSNKLQMNEDKTEVLHVTAKQIVNLQHLPKFTNINGTCVILKHPVSHMLYSDDTLVYKSFDLDDCLSSIICVEKCVSDV